MKTQIIATPEVRIKRTDNQKITPFLWFNDNAEEAVTFYSSIFKNSSIEFVTRYSEEGAKVSGRQKGTVMTVAFQIEGQDFTAINGGPVFKISPAISFVVNCKTQKEVDFYWEKLTDGGFEGAQQCGWLQDRYGVSWQIVPAALGELLGGTDPLKSGRVMQAMLQMKKLDIKTLQMAYDQQ